MGAHNSTSKKSQKKLRDAQKASQTVQTRYLQPMPIIPHLEGSSINGVSWIACGPMTIIEPYTYILTTETKGDILLPSAGSYSVSTKQQEIKGILLPFFPLFPYRFSGLFHLLFLHSYFLFGFFLFSFKFLIFLCPSFSVVLLIFFFRFHRFC